MALNFPGSPTNGQAYQGFVYNSTVGAWQSNPAAVAPFYTADLPPTNPTKGDSWFNTNDGTMYIYTYDGNTYQWVEHRSQIAKSQVGLVPIVPATVTIASGTGSTTYLGAVNFSTATSVQLDGVFSAEYKNYLLILNAACTGQGELRFRYTASGTQKSTGYYWGRLRVAGNVFDNYSATGAAHDVLGLTGAYYADGGTGTFTIANPYDTGTSTNLTGSFHSISSGYGTTLVGGTTYRVNERVDGVYIWPAIGAMTGSIQVLGIND